MGVIQMYLLLFKFDFMSHTDIYFKSLHNLLMAF